MSRRISQSVPSPLAWVALIVLVHFAGRWVAFCAPHLVDSMTYSLAAYRFWQPDANSADLIPDKPPGQALLTGWCFRVWPGPPSRAVLIPIESAFMLSAYLVFYRLGRRMLGAGVAWPLTFMYALGHNVYNVIDYTTDGFNLNENYLAFPLILAASAHLGSADAMRRGLMRGLAVGIALTIKQTAAGLLIAMLVDDIWRWWTHRECRLAHLWPATAAGMMVGVAPTVLVLAWRGWLMLHLTQMSQTTGMHWISLVFERIEYAKMLPLLPMCWWIVVGALARPPKPDGNGRPSPWVPVVAWVAAETWIVWSLSIPAAHYYQQLLAPVCLLASIYMTRFRRSMTHWPRRVRLAGWSWVGAITLALLFYEAVPLGRLVPLRMGHFDIAKEIRVFDEADKSGLLEEIVQGIRDKAHAQQP